MWDAPTFSKFKLGSMWPLGHIDPNLVLETVEGLPPQKILTSSWGLSGPAGAQVEDYVTPGPHRPQLELRIVWGGTPSTVSKLPLGSVWPRGHIDLNLSTGTAT